MSVDLSKIMRLRCPKDGADKSHEHLAIDIRLPLGISALAAVTKRMMKCSCGEGMQIKCDNTPPIGGSS